MSAVEILLIEDNSDDVLLVEAYLPMEYCSLTWGKNAATARDLLHTQNFDLALLDHGLPDTNSLSFLEELRQIKPNLPIIVLTGRNDEALAVSAIKKGAVNYLLKEEIPDHLWAAVREVVGEPSQTARQTAPQTGELFINRAAGIYKVLLETMNEACFVLDFKGIITLANEALANLVGKSVNQLIGSNGFKLFDPDTAACLAESINAPSFSYPNKGNRFEGRINNGVSTTPVMISTRSIVSDDGGKSPDAGKYEGTLVMVSDVSELVVARETLTNLLQMEENQRIQLQSMIEASRDGIIWIDADQRIAVINQQAIALMGLPYTPEDYIGILAADFIEPFNESHPNIFHLSQITPNPPKMDEGNYPNGELTLSPKIIKWVTMPIHAGNSPIGWMTVLYDVTQERELTHLRDEFVHMVVHDLKNPINAVLSSLEFVQELDSTTPDQTLTPQQERLMRTATKGASGAIDLVNDILMVYRLENNELPLHKEPVIPQFIVQEILETLAPLGRARNISFNNTFSDAIPSLWADPALVRRIFHNLLDNALRYAPNNSDITLTAAESDSDNMVQFSIGNVGKPIPEELQGRLFQKFAAGKEHKGGNGIGLNFCKLAVEAHEGKIWFDSEDAGTTFHFILPSAA